MAFRIKSSRAAENPAFEKRVPDQEPPPKQLEDKGPEGEGGPDPKQDPRRKPHIEVGDFLVAHMDSRNYVLYKRRPTLKTEWASLGYYPTLHRALEGVLRHATSRTLHKAERNSIQEFLTLYREMEAWLRNTLVPMKQPEPRS